MKLNELGKIKLRKLIEEQLVNVPEGQRIHLDKELLEELLFETIVYKKETGEFLKLPMWSGEFLRKIDLSEVSFEDVSWSLRHWSGDFFEDGYPLFEYMDEEVRNKFINEFYILPENQVIDYSYTNANINFEYSFENKIQDGTFDGIEVFDCNFSGVNLSKINFNRKGNFTNVNFSNSGVSLDCFTVIDSYNCPFFENLCCFDNCNFSGNNFSNLYLDSMCFGKECSGGDVGFYDCEFFNTGINIKYIPNPFNTDGLYDYDFAMLINSGKLDGCYLDNRAILPQLLRPKLPKYVGGDRNLINNYINSCLGKTKEEEYDEQKFYNTIMSDIEGQLKGFKR